MPAAKSKVIRLPIPASGTRELLIFFLLPLFFYAFPALFRDIYGMEARNALFAREMLENGISFVPTLMGRPYPDYPPLYFLLEYLFSLPAGRVTTFTAVLPSALSASALVWMVWRYLKPLSPHLGAASALILATTPGFFLKASHATVDMLLALTTFAAFCLLVQAVSPTGNCRNKALLYLAIFSTLALSMLTKGPAGIVIPLGATGFYLFMDREWKRLFRFIAFSAAISAILALLYFLLVYFQGGRGLLLEVWRGQVAERVGTEANRPFYYYISYLLTSFAPWPAAMALLFSILVKGRKKWWAKQQTGAEYLPPCHASIDKCITVIKQCAAGLFFIFALFSVASSRHGRYLLPAFPFIAIIMAACMNTISCRAWKKFHLGDGAKGDDEPRKSSLTTFYGTSFRYIALTALASTFFLAANAMFIEPLYASKESGRTFINLLEQKIPPETPIFAYDINPDGDGLKLAFYSSDMKRLVFLYRNRRDKIVDIPLPATVITYPKRLREIKKRFKTTPLLTGLLHNKKVVAVRLAPYSSRSSSHLLPYPPRDFAAMRAPSARQWGTGHFSSNPWRKPAANASPAPVLSTTLSTDTASRNQSCPCINAAAPLAPCFTTISGAPA